MAEDNTEQLGLDASDYFASLDKILDYGKKWLTQNQSLVDSYEEMGGDLSKLRLRIEDLDSENKKLASTLKLTDDGLKIVSNTIKIQTQDLLLYQTAIAETIDALTIQAQKEREIALAHAESTPQSVIGNFVASGGATEQINENIQAKLKEVLANEQLAEQDEAIAEGDRAVAAAEAAVNAAIKESIVEKQIQLAIDNQINAKRAETFQRLQDLNAQQQISIQKQAEVHALNQQLAESFNEVGDAGEKAGNGITLSWQSMERLLVTSIIHRAIYEIIGDFKQAIETAQEFEIRISEIRSISQQNQLSFDQWSSSIKTLSDQFGTPILDTAEAAYQTLSNQVAQGAASFGFLNTALQFSQVTTATAKDSVNLLSSAINSFNLGVDQADHIAAVFFNTIAIGRLRADDLSNIFGRIAPLAHSLGVSFEETNAAIATLTVRGIPANEAMTLLNNVFSHLLNPTKEMKELFAELGVNSGETAIATFGLAGTLDKIQQFAHGSSTEVAALEKDIRAIRGALDLTGDSLISFKKNLEGINNVEPFDLAKKISVESAGKKFEIELNEIKNFFVHDFGETFLAEVVSVGDATNSLGITTNGLVSDVKGLVEIVKVGIETFAIYYAGQKALGALTLYNNFILASEVAEYETLTEVVEAYTAAIASSRAVQFLTSPSTIAIAAVGGLLLYYNNLVEVEAEAKAGLESLDVRSQQAATEQNKLFNANQDAQTERLKESLGAQLSSYLEFGAGVNRLLNDLQAHDVEVMKEIARATKDAFKVAVDDIEESIRKLQEDSRTAASEIRDANKEIADIIEGLKTSTFEHQLKLLPQPEQVDALFEDINKHTELAAIKLRQQVGDAGTAKTNREEAIKSENAALSDQNRLVDILAKAQSKIKEDQDKLVELQTEQVANANKTVDVEAVRNLQRLEQEYNDSRKSNNTIYSEQLKAQLDLARQKVQLDSSGESARRIDERIQKTQQEIAAEQAIIDKINARGDLEAGLDRIQKAQVDNLKAYSDMLDKIKKADDEKLAQEKKRLEVLEDTLHTIEAIKIPATIKTEGEANQFIKQNFDDPLQKALQAGALTDSKLAAQLHTERVQLQESLQTQVLQNQKKAADEELIQRKKTIEDALNAESAAINKARDARATAAEKLKGIVGSVDSQGNPIVGEAAKSQGFTDDQVKVLRGLGGNKFVRDEAPGTAVDDLLKGGNADSFAKKLGDLFDQIQTLRTQELGPARGDPNILAAAQEAANKALNDFIKATNDQATAQLEFQKSQNELKQAGISEITATHDSTAAVQSNTEKILDAIQAITTLNNSIIQLNNTLPHNLPESHPQQSFNYNPAAVPGLTRGLNSTNTSNSTVIQSLSVNITPQGPVDATAIQDGINEAIRRGTFKINAGESALS